MRLHAAQTSPLLILITTLLFLIFTTAKPFTIDLTTTYTVSVPDSPTDPNSNQTLLVEERGCANPCGYYGQVCCQSGETCITDSNNEAQCSSGSGGSAGVTTAASGSGSGYWQYYTSTWVETDTVTKTSVYSSFVGGGGAASSVWAPTTPVGGTTATAAAANCNWSSGESSCGNICCPSGQYCQVAGQCAPAAGGSVSAPLRPTSSGTYTVQTETSFSTTTTEPFISPIATGQSMNVTETSATGGGGGLSGGAIAGIVIGVIAAIILLILLALFLCFRGIWNLLFGRKRGTRRRETIVEEHIHRSSGGGAASRRWYGGGASSKPPRRVVKEEKTTRRGFGPAALGGGLGAAFGLGKAKRARQERERRRYDEKSDYSSSYGYSYYSGGSK